MLPSWLSRWSKRRSPGSRFTLSGPSFRPRLETLEDRTLLNAGALDPTFGTGGTVLSDLGMSAAANAVAVQPDGKVVVAGVSSEVDTSQIVLARYTTAGKLDPTFGQGGVVTTSLVALPESSAYARNIVLQADGKILVVGGSSTLSAPEQIALVRYNTDGSLDTTFGTDGTASISFDTAGSYRVNAWAASIALQANGKIVLAGSADFSWDGEAAPPIGRGSFSDFAVVRCNADGSLDKTFGTGGRVETAFSVGTNLGEAEATGVALQADGKIVIIGSVDGESFPPSTGGITPDFVILIRDFGVVRYNANGSLDSSFGTGGKILTTFGGSLSSQAEGVAITADGKIVVAGSAGSEFALARYDSNGKLDTGFGTHGVVTTDIAGNGTASVADFVLDGQGRALVFGQVQTQGYAFPEFAVARFGTSGQLDTSFGVAGVTLTPFGGDVAASAVAMQPNGEIVAAGSFQDAEGNSEFALARYQGNPPPMPTTGIEGVAMVGPVTAVFHATGPNTEPLANAIITIQPANGGTEITRVQADANGRFVLALLPGTYRIVPLPPTPGSKLPMGMPETVIVQAGRLTSVVVDYNSEIP